jgi:predicted amidohydrolase YtcJ
LIPGLIDSHLHVIRGGLNFNMELRWDGVRSLADAMAMLKRQVAITPPPQWVTGLQHSGTVSWRSRAVS